MKPLTFAALIVAPAFSTALLDSNALSVVKRAIEVDARTPYTCIREWTSWGSKDTLRIRRDQAASGANRVLVLSPMCQQGSSVVDNGKQRISYNPDRHELTIQDSPLKIVAPHDACRRFELLRRNYRITGEGADRVADRPVMRVNLEPLAQDALFARRYWVDTERSVLLRVEWKSPEGVRQVVSDTVSIDFPKILPPDTFAARFIGTPREIHIQSPVRHKGLGALAQAVGFPVVNPVEMPFGFLYIGADAIKGRNRTMAALRYTDGAANLTVYQASASAGSAPWRFERRLQNVQVDGVWVTVDGDVPPEGKAAVLNALRESGLMREASLRGRLAKMFRAEGASIGRLRDQGLGFDEVAASFAAAKGNEAAAAKAAAELLAGRGADSAAAKAAIRRFWDMRQ